MNPLSIYIHIPFCERKCEYCDFVSFDNCADKIDDYVDALCNEINWKMKGNNYNIETIFFGGGTPSLLSNAQISKIFETLKETFDINPSAEITIECNPNSLTAPNLAHYKNLGINRLSIGIQSFDDTILSTLGRIHTAAQAEHALQMAHTAGFTNINIDLIHSVPAAQTQNKQKQSIAILNKILNKFPFITHISAYSLIVEENTAMQNKVINGILIPPTEDESIAEQIQIEKILKKHGFKKYEVSNFAKSEYECRHNQNYWLPHINEYLGFGLAAASLFNNKRFSNTENLEEYLTLFDKKNTAHQFQIKKEHNIPQQSDVRTNQDIITEIIMLGLRTAKGISFNDLLVLGCDLKQEKSNQINELLLYKLITIKKGRLAATPKGFYVLNKIIEKLC